MPEGFEIGLHAKFDLRCQFPPVNKPGKSGAYTGCIVGHIIPKKCVEIILNSRRHNNAFFRFGQEEIIKKSQCMNFLYFFDIKIYPE